MIIPGRRYDLCFNWTSTPRFAIDPFMTPRHITMRPERRRHRLKHLGLNAIESISLFTAVALLCWLSITIISRIREDRLLTLPKIDIQELWKSRPSNGWHGSSVAGDNWLFPSSESNGFLLLHCSGGLNEHRIAISSAVLVAKIMNATLVLPEFDTESIWPDTSGFSDIYDVDHFIKSLESDVEIVRTAPRIRMVGYKKKPLRAFQLQPPKNSSPDWYQTVAVDKMKEHGAVYFTEFSKQLTENIPLKEYQKLRCRVNFHALRFSEDVRQLSYEIVNHLRSEGPFMAVQFPSEMRMHSLDRCVSLFTTEEQEILKSRLKNSKVKIAHDKSTGACPLTPGQVGPILQSMGVNNSTRIYVAVGHIFEDDRFIEQLRAQFPLLETRSSIISAERFKDFDGNEKSLLGIAVDYMVCLMADVFLPAYDELNGIGNSLIGHRLYNGFRTTIRLNLKALAYKNSGSLDSSKLSLLFQGATFGDVHHRGSQESFYNNPWPECFCKKASLSEDQKCFRNRMWDAWSWQLLEDGMNASRS